MEIVYHSSFLKSAARMPEDLQRKLAELLELMRENPFHPKLHTKHLAGDLAGVLSFRITRDWRGTFRFIDPGAIQLLRVAHRRDIYR